MGHDHKTDAIFFVLFYEVFLKQKYKSFETKMFLRKKHLQNESVFETKMKLFFFLKWKYFNL